MAPSSPWSGAAVAFSIAFIAAVIGLGTGAPFLWLGIPAATVAGWVVGPRVPASGGVVGTSVAMAVATIAIADTLVVIVEIGSSMSGPSGGIDVANAIGGSIFLWGAGFVIVGIPMMLITVPCGIVWAVLVQLLARQSAGAATDAKRHTT